MKTRFLFLLLFINVSGMVKAQVTIHVQLPPSGIVQNSQLWNITLSNTDNSTQFVNVILTLLQTNTNQPVLTASTKLLNLAKGVMQLNESNLNPIQYTYLQGSNANAGGLLPIGNYTACYTVNKVFNERYLQIAEDCQPLEVAPLSPPMLNTPDNEAILETLYPQFTWLPPTPLNLFTNLTYDLVLTEVMPGQNFMQAIQQNIPVYSAGNITNLFDNYPASRKSLDTGKAYAWRVIARNNQQFVTQSDVWTFKVKYPEQDTLITENSGYLKLKRGYEAGVAVVSDLLKIEYPNYDNDATANCTLKSLDDPGRVLSSYKIPVKPGLNYIEISLRKSGKLEENKTYLLELKNNAGNDWSVKFLFKNEK